MLYAPRRSTIGKNTHGEARECSERASMNLLAASMNDRRPRGSTHSSIHFVVVLTVCAPTISRRRALGKDYSMSMRCFVCIILILQCRLAASLLVSTPHGRLAVPELLKNVPGVMRGTRQGAVAACCAALPTASWGAALDGAASATEPSQYAGVGYAWFIISVFAGIKGIGDKIAEAAEESERSAAAGDGAKADDSP